MVELLLTHEIESLSGVSRVEDLDYDGGDSLHESSEYSIQRETAESTKKGTDSQVVTAKNETCSTSDVISWSDISGASTTQPSLFI